MPTIPIMYLNGPDIRSALLEKASSLGIGQMLRFE
jgi:hypothetical protein